jgi:hypothetical protein
MICLTVIGGVTCLLILAWLVKELSPYHSDYSCGYTNSYEAPKYICLYCKIKKWIGS